MGVSHHIGLEIAERIFRVVEIQQQDRHATILRADVYPTAHDYSSPLLFELPFDGRIARDFITDLAAIFLNDSVYAGSVSVVLPSVLPLVSMLPVDRVIPAGTQRALLEWECETLAGYGPERRLSILTHPVDDGGRTLAVALPETSVAFLRATCEHLTLDLAAIETDHFVMENVLRLLYPHETEGGFGVLGLYPDHCSAGVHSGDHYLGFRHIAITHRHQYAAQAVHLLESIPGYHDRTSPLRLFAYGPAADDALLDALGGVFGEPIIRCVPLAGADAPSSLRDAMQRQGERDFDVPAAAALLGASCA